MAVRPGPRRRSRLLALMLAAATLGGCQETFLGTPLSLWAAGASVGSFVVLERGLFDAGYSLVTGKDCSVVNLERGGPYCRTEAVAQPAPFCTRTIGTVDCWTVAEPYGPQRPVADTPVPPERVPARWSLSPF